MGISFEKVVGQLIFNCPLLPNPRNSLAGKRPITQKFLATPLLQTKVFHLWTKVIKVIYLQIKVCHLWTKANKSILSLDQSISPLAKVIKSNLSPEKSTSPLNESNKKYFISRPKY